MKRRGCILILLLILIFLNNSASARRVKGVVSVESVVSVFSKIADTEKDPGIKLVAAVTMCKLGRKEQALKIVDSFNAADDPVIKALQAVAYYNMGELDKALELIEKLRELDNPKVDEILDREIYSSFTGRLNNIIKNNYNFEEKKNAINAVFNMLQGAMQVTETITGDIVKVLKHFAQDKDFNVRIYLAQKLSLGFSPLFTSVLLELAQDDNWQVRWESYKSLKNIAYMLNAQGPVVFMQSFQRDFYSSLQSRPFFDIIRPVRDNFGADFSFREKVITMLQGIKEEKSIIDEEDIVRLEIVGLLREVGINSQGAKDMLKDIEDNDPDRDVRAAAFDSLNRLFKDEETAKEGLNELLAMNISNVQLDTLMLLGAYWLNYGFSAARDRLIDIVNETKSEGTVITSLNGVNSLLVLQILAERKDERVKELLLSCVENSNIKPIRSLAFLAMAHKWWLDDNDVGSVLANDLNGEHNEWSFAVAYELIKFGNVEQRNKGIEYLTQVAKNSSFPYIVRYYAFLILGTELAH